MFMYATSVRQGAGVMRSRGSGDETWDWTSRQTLKLPNKANFAAASALAGGRRDVDTGWARSQGDSEDAAAPARSAPAQPPSVAPTPDRL